MSIATRSAVHRDRQAARSWLSVAPARAAASRRHRRAGSRLADDGSAAVLRRALGAGAVWLVAFGSFSIAEGWSRAGAPALVIGVFIALGVAASNLVRAAPGSVDNPMVAHSRGVNLRRNGYRPMT
jgi:hypothetical protein